MSGGWMNIGTRIGGEYDSEVLEDFLAATEEFEREHDVEQGQVLRELARMLRKQCRAAALKRKYDFRA